MESLGCHTAAHATIYRPLKGIQVRAFVSEEQRPFVEARSKESGTLSLPGFGQSCMSHNIIWLHNPFIEPFYLILTTLWKYVDGKMARLEHRRAERCP
jgi:hypothetical protein